MKSKDIQDKVSQNKYKKTMKGIDLCEVSKASTEIMLERFCNGNEIDFPFSQ